MAELEFHSFAEIWPLLDGADLEAFTRNIKLRGQVVPILTYQGKVLDGRNRYRACRALGIEPRCEPANVKNDEEALELVVSLNDQRRHMEAGARAIAAAKLATLRHGSNQFRTEQGRSRDRSTSHTAEEAAKKLGISVKSVERAKVILEHGDPETIKAVETGKLPIKATAEKLRAKRQPKPKPGQPTNAERRAAFKEARAKLLATPQRVLTREEVDPDFVGTPLEFSTLHGHVQSQTAAEKAASQQRFRVDALATALRDFIRAIPTEEISEDDVFAWFAADGSKNRQAREERLASRIEAIRALMNDRLYPLFAQIESRLKGRPVEVQRAG